MEDKALIAMLLSTLKTLTGLPEVYTSDRAWRLVMTAIDKVEDEQSK